MQEVSRLHILLESFDLFLCFDFVVIEDNIDVAKTLAQDCSLLCERNIFETGDLMAIRVRTGPFRNLQNALVDKWPHDYVHGDQLWLPPGLILVC